MATEQSSTFSLILVRAVRPRLTFKIELKLLEFCVGRGVSNSVGMELFSWDEMAKEDEANSVTM